MISGQDGCAKGGCAKLKAGLVAGALSYPDTEKGFVIKKAVFSGKAFAYVNILSDVKVIMLMPNTFPPQKQRESSYRAIGCKLWRKGFWCKS
jgi:electron transfer flavoprotein alpha subunit